MVKKTYLSPQTNVFVFDEQDVVKTSGYHVATEGNDDNMGTWEEVFGA